MHSLDGDTRASLSDDVETRNERAPGRTWIPITVAPSVAPKRTDETPTAAPDLTNLPRAPPSTEREPTSGNVERGSSDSGSNAEGEVPIENGTVQPRVEEEVETTAPSTRKKENEDLALTRSPFLEQTTPVPNDNRTSGNANSVDDSASGAAGDGSSSSEPTRPPKRERRRVKPKTQVPTSATAANEGSSGNSRERDENVKLTNQNVNEKSKESLASDASNGDDPMQTVDSTPSFPSSSNSSSSDSGSVTLVVTDAAMGNGSFMSNTLMLGLLMGGAVAVVLIIAVFVYMKTSSSVEEEDDMTQVLQAGHADGHKPVPQSSTIAANYHQNHDLSPMNYDDEDYPPNQDGLYDQEPYGHQDQLSMGRLTYNDPNLDMLTPRSQIALAHSQMSLPSMAESGYSKGSSQYSDYSAQSSFYDQSNYSGASNSSSAYANRRDDDDSGLSGDDSDFDGDSVKDMSNVWNTAGRNKSRQHHESMMDESQFEPADSRSTSASSDNGGRKDQYFESEYAGYQVSSEYDDSFAATNSDYDEKDYDKSGYSDSGYSDSGYNDSGYDNSFTGGKSFQSSGFSNYDQSMARSKSRHGDSSSFYRGNDSRFTDKSYY